MAPLSVLGLISLFKDLTDAVQRVGEHYIGIGEHSDLWRGQLEVDGVSQLVRLLSSHVRFYSWQITGRHKSSSWGVK